MFSWLSARRPEGARAVRRRRGPPPLRDAHGRDAGEGARAVDTPSPGLPLGDVVPAMARGIALIRAADGTFLYTNDAWTRMFGYAPGELDGRHISVITTPSEHPPEGVAADMLGSLDRDGAWKGETENVRRDGSRISVELDVSRLDGADGGTWVVAGADVSERHAGEVALQDAERRYRSTFEADAQATALVADGQQLLDVNDAFSKATGWTRQELVGSSLATLTGSAQLGHEFDVLARRGDRGCFRSRARLRAREGVVVDVGVVGTIVRGVGGIPLHGVLVLDEPPAAPRPSGAQASSTE